MTRVVWLTAALALCTAPGCKRSKTDARDKASTPSASAPIDARSRPRRPTRILITSIEISTVDPAHKREIYPRLLAQKLSAQLGTSGLFAVAVDQVPNTHDPEPGVLELLVGYDVIEQGLGQKSAFATVKARVRWARGGVELPVREQVVTERPLKPKDLSNLDGIVAQHVERSVATLGEGLIARESLRVGPPAKVIEALTGSDAATTLWALEVVAHRKLAGAHDAVVALLGSGDHDLRDGAIATLVTLGDPNAVDPLTKTAKLGDLGLLRSIVEAVSVLGGSDAEVYLEFLSSGHEDDDIRQLATDALARVRARAGASSPAAANQR